MDTYTTQTYTTQADVDTRIVNSLAEADEVVDKIRNCHLKINALTEAAQLMKQKPLEKIREIDNWLANETKSINSYIESLTARLRPYVEVQVAGKKRRSISLPSGKAGFIKGSTYFTFNGEPANNKNLQLLDYAINHELNDYIKQEPKFDWASFKKMLIVDGEKVITADGEIIDGMKAITEPDKFTVKPNEIASCD